MAYTKTMWVDHVATRPNTYNEVVNQDGTKTLTPAGETQQEGTPVNAQNLNHMEQGIADAQNTADNAATAAGNAAQAAADNLVTAKSYADEKAAAEVGTHAAVDITTGVHGLKYDAVNNKFKRKNGDNWEDIDIGVTVDDDFSTTSENPVQNKVITATLFSSSPNVTLSANSITTLKNASTTVTVSRSGEGAITATSSDTSVATVSVSGTTITVTGGSASGSATITVKCARSVGYMEQTVTLSVSNILADSTLANNTPETIKIVAQAGQAANLWSVGDKTSGISISGTVGSLSINGTYYAFILGFNHNSSREGSNSIHFALGMTSGGTRIAFCDSKYNSQASGAYFNMNTSNTNSGGWSSSYMRSTILPAFKNAIASAWRNVMASVTKYSDNTGGGSDTASYVTSTTDTLFLLAEFEVQGARSYANSKEKDYQQQYTYFANGNGKVFYKHDATTTACGWWLRSVYATSSSDFCFVSTDGSAGFNVASYSYGVVLGFVIK